MKKSIIYISALALSLSSCIYDFENDIKQDAETTYTTGQADFSQYVAIGNSLTAGYMNATVYASGQQQSYANQIAQQLQIVGAGEFTQPSYLEDTENIGGLVLAGTPIASNRNVLSLELGAPKYLEGTSKIEVSNLQQKAYNNMGVPGAKSFHLLSKGYGNIANLSTGTANPYFVRTATSPEASIMEDAKSLKPSFFSVWIGSNDMLSYATSGGTGVDQTGNFNPATYSGNDITDPMVFAQAYTQIVETLMLSTDKGILANLPSVSSIPFFNTVPNNALVLSKEQASSLTNFFKAYAAIAQKQIGALAAQYLISFKEGANRFLIKTDVTAENPLGLRQAEENELVLLTIDRSKIMTQGYGSVALSPELMTVLGKLATGKDISPEEAMLVLAAVNPIEDKDILDNSELLTIERAQVAYNTVIEKIASDKNLALVDMNKIMNKISANGYADTDGVIYNADYFSKETISTVIFSLDGVHPNPRGYAIMANEFIKAINAKYESTTPLIRISSKQGITLVE